MKIWRTYQTEFEAAHHIKEHPTCGTTHGHSYRVKVSVLGDTATFVDFHRIKNATDSQLIQWDHSDLGDKTCEALVLDLTMAVEIYLFNQINTGKVKVAINETSKFGVETAGQD